MKIAILHHNDADGFGAAYAAWKGLKDDHELKFIPVQYGQEPPLEELREFGAEEIYIVDFSYKPEAMNRLFDEWLEIIVIDHHKTTAEDMFGGIQKGWVVFDPTKSGAILTWEHFFDTEPPAILRYVQDRDLWKFELPNSKEVNAYIAQMPWEFEVWDNFSLEEALKVGGALVALQKKQIEGRLKDVRMVHFVSHPSGEGYLFLGERGGIESSEILSGPVSVAQVPIVNASENISELGEAMCFKYPDSPFSISYCDRSDGKRTYSLRSRNGFDVSVVAKAFGGGGHPSAAGFPLDAPEVI